ncbi:hypothetical protein EON81_04550 [bacterium]|nr:MAG: hypothetical protein EON81_04550 [bacterium]
MRLSLLPFYRSTSVGTALLALAGTGSAQAQNELLQISSVRIGRTTVEIDWSTIPGSGIGGNAFDRIDVNRDGMITQGEGQAYVKRTLKDVTLTVDGKSRPLLMRRVSLSDRKPMLAGFGSIQFLVYAVIPERPGRHTLVFENRHRRAVSKFETTVWNDPANPSLRIVDQRLDAAGARLSLTYVPGKAPSPSTSSHSGS